MSDSVGLPFLNTIVPGGCPFGANYLVEFEPHSLWYETMLTWADEALTERVKTDLHTFSHIPGEMREALSKLGTDVPVLEEKDILRIIDSFTITTGIESPERNLKTFERYQSKSIHLAEWAEAAMHEITEGVPENERRRLHLDDNLSVLAQYNEEKAFVDYWRTRFVPWSRSLHLTVVHSLSTGVHSSAFYNQFETLCDGIFDFQSREGKNGIEHYFRVRTVRGRPHDSSWKRLHLERNGRIIIDSKEPRDKTLGMRGWIKGPK